MEPIEERYLEAVIERLRNRKNSFGDDMRLAHVILQADAELKKGFKEFDKLDIATKIDVVSMRVQWKLGDYDAGEK